MVVNELCQGSKNWNCFTDIQRLKCLTGAIVMWTAPQPSWNQTVPGDHAGANIQTAVIRVLNGTTNFHVKWKYTLLPAQRISLITYSVGDGILWEGFGYIFDPGTSSERTEISDWNDYSIRFSVTTTREFSSTTIHTVTERENATFQCKLVLGGTVWAYNVRIFVAGKTESPQPTINSYPFT